MDASVNGEVSSFTIRRNMKQAETERDQIDQLRKVCQFVDSKFSFVYIGVCRAHF